MSGLQPDIMGRLNELGAGGVPARLGIMGGTFDPIHVAHLRVAEEVREKLRLDGVLFIPAGVPVFKKGHAITPARERLEHVCCAVASNPHFGVCDIEVIREGDTYTVDTLRALRAKFAPQVQFYFIVGDDAAPSLPLWRGVDELATLATFVVAGGRPGAHALADIEDALTQQAPQLTVEYVEVRSLEVSSHELRELAACGASMRYLVPEAIRVELMRSGREHEHDGVGASAGAGAAAAAEVDVSMVAGAGVSAGAVEKRADQRAAARADERLQTAAQGNESCAPCAAYSDEFFEARRAELRTRVSEKRFAHCEAVSQTAVTLAQRYGVSTDAARLAGLLHDWDKGYDDEGIRRRVRELGMEDEIDPLVVHSLPGTLHGITAARALAREFPSIPAEVIQAIERHTVAHVHMEPLDMVLYVADAIEPARQFGRVDELRACVQNAALEELFFETYRYWTSLLLERNRMLHPDTIRIWNTYSSRLHPKTRKQES